MTQAEIDKKLIDTHRVRGAEADELIRDVGCQVIQIGPTREAGVWVEVDEAERLAASLTHDHPDRMYVVMVPLRVYHGAKYKTPAPETEAGA